MTLLKCESILVINYFVAIFTNMTLSSKNTEIIIAKNASRFPISFSIAFHIVKPVHHSTTK